MTEYAVISQLACQGKLCGSHIDPCQYIRNILSLNGNRSVRRHFRQSSQIQGDLHHFFGIHTGTFFLLSF